MNEFFKKLIDRLKEKAYEIRFEGGTKIIEFADAIKIINQFAEEYKGGWIPCSERLPEAGERVLVSTQSFVCESYMGLEYEKTKWYRYGVVNSELLGQKVLAWQPLPEHYQPEGDDHE